MKLECSFGDSDKLRKLFIKNGKYLFPVLYKELLKNNKTSFPLKKGLCSRWYFGDVRFLAIFTGNIDCYCKSTYQISIYIYIYIIYNLYRSRFSFVSKSKQKSIELNICLEKSYHQWTQLQLPPPPNCTHWTTCQ